MAKRFALTLYIAVTTICLAGDSADRDYSWSIEGGDVDECRFVGCVETGGNACKQVTECRDDFEQGGDLTWEILIEACPDIKRAGCADESYDDRSEDDDDYVSMDSLEWPYNYCTCPRCPCTVGDGDTYYTRNVTTVTSTNVQQQICYRCECDFFYWNEDDNGEYGFDCDYRYGTYNPDGYELFTCDEDGLGTSSPTPAPTGGCDNGDGVEYDQGQSFFYWEDDGECDTYCYCNSTFGTVCEKGWGNIMSNEVLKYKFLDSCGYALGDCWNTTGANNDTVLRWFKNYPTFYCDADYIIYDAYQCPLCNCTGGGYDVDDEWNDVLTYNSVTYDDNGDIDKEYYNCADCECKQGDFAVEKDYVDCDVWDYGETSFDECVRPSDRLQCMQGDDNDYEDVYSATCNSDYGQTYCSWFRAETPDDEDPDSVCVESQIEDEGSWGCQYDWICNAFFDPTELSDSSSGLCSYNDISFTAQSYDCVNNKWLSETYQLHFNFYCCEGDDCNDQQISETGCVDGNDAMGDYFKSLYGCYYSNRGVSKTDFQEAFACGRALPENKYDACDVIPSYWSYYTSCVCSAYRSLEKNYQSDEDGDKYTETLQALFDSEFSSEKATLTAWAEAFECSNIDVESDFECDVTAYDGVESLKIKISILSTICTLLFYYL